MFRARNSLVLSCKSLVGTSDDSCLGSNFRIVGQKETSFSGVDHFVRLTTDSASNSFVTGVNSLPVNTKTVGTIFKKNGIVLVAQFLDLVHIGQFSAHVRNHDVVAVRVFLEFLLKVLGVDDVISVGFYVNSLSASVFNGTRNGSESEGITQNLVSLLKTGGLQQKHKRRPTRVESDTVLETGVVADLLLALADNTILTRGDIVTIKASGFHQLQGF
mmetsp:Transcript_25344/g.38929  ORF Transcript_25344/g.38929 Transcript_25344/m.38929 type:complete len:217 (+) Transcript_25344:631-1281(+)